MAEFRNVVERVEADRHLAPAATAATTAATMPTPQVLPPDGDLEKKYPLAFEAPLPTRPPLHPRSDDELDAMHIPGVDRDALPHIQMDQIDMALTEVYQVAIRAYLHLVPLPPLTEPAGNRCQHGRDPRYTYRIYSPLVEEIRKCNRTNTRGF